MRVCVCMCVCVFVTEVGSSGGGSRLVSDLIAYYTLYHGCVRSQADAIGKFQLAEADAIGEQ